MKLIVHDLEPEQFRSLFPIIPEGVQVVGPERGSIKPCVGCFCCWTKTPGHCVIRDGFGDFSTVLGKAEDYLLISRCVYGGFSPFVKNILDRNIGYILPFFTIRDNEVHHKLRYPHPLRLTVGIYGANQEEQETVLGLVKANSLNLGTTENRVVFARDPEGLVELREVLA